MSISASRESKVIISLIDSLVEKLDSLSLSATTNVANKINESDLSNFLGIQKNTLTLEQKINSASSLYNEHLYSLASLLVFVNDSFTSLPSLPQLPNKIEKEEILKYLSTKLNPDSFARLTYAFAQCYIATHTDFKENTLKAIDLFMPAINIKKEFALYAVHECMHVVYISMRQPSHITSYLKVNHQEFWPEVISINLEKSLLNQAIAVYSAQLTKEPTPSFSGLTKI